MKNNIIKNYLSLIQEGYLFSDKTISIDLNKFESGESNTLLVVGLIGSGKTTLGNYLAKEYKAQSLHTDKCIAWTIAEHPPNKKLISEYYKCILKMINSNKKSVVEGTGLIDLMLDKKELFDYPMIIIGKSALASSIQSMLRNRKNKEEKFWRLISIHTRLNFKTFYKKILEVRKERLKIPGAVIEEYKVPKL
jgi:adenylate kinase family enzyme